MPDEDFFMVSEDDPEQDPVMIEMDANDGQRVIRAQVWYYAYCNTENRRIGSDTLLSSVAENDAYKHRLNFPGHSTSVRSKLK